MQSSRASDKEPALVTGRLNVNEFVAARKEDIRVLERLLSSAGSKSKKRAFQSLPRTERRRAASHDAKRVPRKHGLRKRAELENLQGNAKKLKTSGRPRPPLKAPQIKDYSTLNVKAQFPADGFGVRFADRQQDKIWLPTHVWHKKRAFVDKLGSYMVPTTATQKQYRRTHRLLANKGEPGVMAWDTSFTATIVVEEEPAPTGATSCAYDELLEAVLPGVTNKIYRSGSKHWQGLFRSTGPVIVYWFLPTKLAIMCHPFLFDTVWDYFDNSALSLNLQDARYAIGSIDLFGPNALTILSDTLTPCPGQSVSTSWKSFASLASPDLLPSRFVLEYNARDPRLFGKRFRRHGSAREVDNISQMIDVELLKENRGAVYDSKRRCASFAALFDQSHIDQRKKDPISFIQGTDAEIPVCVLVLDDGRIRVQLPRAWVLPTWLTIFTRKQTMIGGQNELHQLAFEQSCPFFPVDYPLTEQSALLRSNPLHMRALLDARSHLDESGSQSAFTDSAPQMARITMIGRGTLASGSTIFEISKTNLDQWLKSANEMVEDKIEHEHCIGYVTTAGFNLMHAKSTGLGLLKAPGKHYSSKYCLVSNKNSQELWLAEFVFMKPEEIARVA